MKKNIWLLIGIICVVIGTAFACFTDIADDIPALFVAAFGLGAIIVSTWNKSEKKEQLQLFQFCVPVSVDSAVQLQDLLRM